MRFRYDIAHLLSWILSQRPKVRLGRKSGPEALERRNQRVDLEERVLAQLRRVDRELEVDLVRAVRDWSLSRGDGTRRRRSFRFVVFSTKARTWAPPSNSW
jgi:hypothetical protein